MEQKLRNKVAEKAFATENLPAAIKAEKEKAANFFLENGFFSKKDPHWENTQYETFLNSEYLFSSREIQPEDKLPVCRVPIHATKFSLTNGFSKEASLQVFPNGLIVGSFAKAAGLYPELVARYYGKAAKEAHQNGFFALNTVLATDGLFVYVPENVVVENPVQMQNMISSLQPLFIQTRNLIILEKNSRLQLVHCDDSYDHHASFSNHLTEIFVGENAHVEHYKMQNLNDNSALLNFNFIEVQAKATVITHAITLNGGMIHNESEINLRGERVFVDANGLYVMDKEQKIDNRIEINHHVPNCQSKQLYKGILDDSALATFHGHIFVAKNAKGTEAYQSNKNLLLSEKAKIVTQPFLEIYNDDVKCSHGATTGQLDTNALFYIRARGIGERMAKLLLMGAYCQEVINKIGIDSLKEALTSIVEKRLNGGLTVCNQCSLDCAECNPIDINSYIE